MTSSFPTHGILAALWTPLDHEGRLNKPALARHLQFLKHCGVHGILALGSTGEFQRLTTEQRLSFAEDIAALAAPLPVLVNISHIDPKVVVQLGRNARSLGLPGVSVMPPHFYPVSPPDMLEHFLRAADAAQLPVMLYNFPELVGTKIGLETVQAFAERGPMAAIKQSGREFSYHYELVALGREKKFAVFSGADTRIAEVIAAGGAGIIGGYTNWVPDLMLDVYRICVEAVPGDLKAAEERLRDVAAIVERLTFTHNMAAGLEARGFDPGVPKMAVSATSRALYGEVVSSLRALFRQWELIDTQGQVAV
jgi:dihydrodipicolinate synthase/N-acetylneuraminate lyase